MRAGTENVAGIIGACKSGTDSNDKQGYEDKKRKNAP